MAAQNPLIIRVAADIQSLVANMSEGKAQIEALGSAVQDISKKLNAAKLIQDANNVTAAIAEVGGASTLTASQAATQLALLERAMDKLEATGKGIPPAMEATAASLRDVVKAGEESNTAMHGVSDVWGSLTAQFAAGALVVQGVEALKGIAEAAFASGAQIEDMSLKTGLSIESVQRLSFAANQTGTSMEVVGKAVTIMSKNLEEGTNDTAQHLDKLGLSLTDLQKMDPEEAFNAIAGAIAKLPDPMLQADEAMKLLGKSGAELLPAIREGLIGLEDQADVMSSETVHALKEAELEWKAFYNTIVVETGKALVFFKDHGADFAALADPFSAESMKHWAGMVKDAVSDYTDAFDNAGKHAEDAAASQDKLNTKIEASIHPQQLVGAALMGTAASMAQAELAMKNFNATYGAQNKAIDENIKKYDALHDTLFGSHIADQINTLNDNVAHATADEYAWALAHGTLIAAMKPLVAEGGLALLSTKLHDLYINSVAIPDVNAKVKTSYDALIKVMPNVAASVQQAGKAIQDAEKSTDAIASAIESVNGKVKNTIDITKTGPNAAKQVDDVGKSVEKFEKTAEEARKQIEQSFVSLGNMLPGVAGQMAGIVGESVALGDSFGKAKSAAQGLGGINWSSMLTGITGIVSAAIQIGGAVASALGIGQTKGRDLVDSFAQQQGGYDKLHDTLDALGASGEDLWKKLTQGVGQNNPTQAKQVIDQVTAALKAQSDAVALAATQATGRASAQTGLNAALGVTSKAYDDLQTAQDTLTSLQTQYGTASEDAQAGIQDQIDATTKTIQTQQQIIAATGITTKTQAAAVSASIIGIINGNMQAGQSFVDAVKAAQPAIDGLSRQLVAAGLDGGKAFDFVKSELDLATDAVAGPALTAVEGYTQAMKGLGDAGLLNQDTFSGLEEQIGKTYATLVAQGKDGKAVLAAMQPDLQAAWEAEQKFGFKADDTTQRLIDQGVQAGIVGENHKTWTDQLLDALGKMETDLDLIAKGLTGPNGVQAAAESAAGGVQGAFDNVHIRIPVDFDVQGPDLSGVGRPDFDGGNASGGGQSPAADVPVTAVTRAGNVYVKPGDVVGMPHLGDNTGGGMQFEAHIYIGGDKVDAQIIQITQKGLTNGQLVVPQRNVVTRAGRG